MPQQKLKKIIPVFENGKLDPMHENYPPANVRVALLDWADRKSVPFWELMDALRWDGIMKCWCFTWSGMFVGVETDGHIHT